MGEVFLLEDYKKKKRYKALHKKPIISGKLVQVAYITADEFFSLNFNDFELVYGKYFKREKFRDYILEGYYKVLPMDCNYYYLGVIERC